MSTISGTYRKGKVQLDAPVDWADGLPVQVSPAKERIGLTEGEWPTTAEAKAKWLEWAATFEPVEMSPEEEAEWAAARKAVKQYTLKKMEERWRDEE